MDCRDKPGNDDGWGSWSLLLLLRLTPQDFGLGEGVRVFEFAVGAGPEGGVHAIEQTRIARA